MNAPPPRSLWDSRTRRSPQRTWALAYFRLPDGVELRARGHAKRNPADEPQPRIGEEIAAARVLADLTPQLLNKAAGEISEVTHRPATISVRTSADGGDTIMKTRVLTWGDAE